MSRFLITFFLTILSWHIAYGQYSFNDFGTAEKKRFNKIRMHLHKIPSHEVVSIYTLSNQVREVAFTDLEKAYAAFYWISRNITYDMKSFLADKSPSYHPKEVLKTRVAICSGYAHLFKALCDKLEVSSEILSGYSKGYGYSPDKPFGVSNHSWNSVFIDQKWFLIDATWAASKSNDRAYTIDVNESYFLMHPKVFIRDHLPEDSKWQLLSPQLSLSDFEENKAVLNNVQYSLVINDDIEHMQDYVDIGNREVAMQKRILAFNPKNTDAIYKLGVALMYQALDTMDTMHQLSYENVLLATPQYKYRIYDLLDQAALCFERVPQGSTYKSAQSFLSETTYQKGVFNYEVAQIIYDTTLPLSKGMYETIKTEFAKARISYYKIALDYFQSIPPSSWYYDNSQDYLRVITEEQRDVINSLSRSLKKSY